MCQVHLYSQNVFVHVDDFGGVDGKSGDVAFVFLYVGVKSGNQIMKCLQRKSVDISLLVKNGTESLGMIMIMLLLRVDSNC